ncbi:MAG: c-type cytochrome, partial [Candidatus Dormibacteraeota bacterium]|nr:c-type cytochrome [Candidatus Dormibacteraeota bacterium]
CSWCHGMDGSGTHNGPSLIDVGAQAADFYLRTGRMPLSSPTALDQRGKPAYDDATIKALVQYVGSLGQGPGIPAVAAGDPVRGRELFLQNCAACHSASGTGTVLSTGRPIPDLWHTADQQVAEAIRIGPGPMPPFGPGQLTASDVNDVVTYVHDLGSRQVQGGNGLDQYGPIAEGLVVFLVLIPCALLVVRLLGRREPEGEK